MADFVSSRVLIRNLLTFSLQSFLAALEVGDLEQVHILHGVADLSVDIGRVEGLDISNFRARFDNTYHIVDVWRETMTAGVVATFNLEIKNKEK